MKIDMKLTIKIGDQKMVLTEQEAKDLRTELNRVFIVNNTYTYPWSTGTTILDTSKITGTSVTTAFNTESREPDGKTIEVNNGLGGSAVIKYGEVYK